MTPTEPNTLRSRSSPHDGQVFSASSVNAWWMSKAWSQFLQRYEYVGMVTFHFRGRPDIAPGAS